MLQVLWHSENGRRSHSNRPCQYWTPKVVSTHPDPIHIDVQRTLGRSEAGLATDRRPSSWIPVTTCLTPVAPKGWPRALAGSKHFIVWLCFGLHCATVHIDSVNVESKRFHTVSIPTSVA